MDIETGGLDFQTAATVANNVRKTRKVFLSCCKGEKSDAGVTKAPIPLVVSVSILGVSIATFTMLATVNTLIDIAAGFIILFCPYLVYQKRLLSELGTFRALHNRLRTKVNELMLQNNVLTSNVDKLESAVNELEQVEEDLSKIANTKNVDRLIHVVTETKRINEKMKKNTQAKIVQQMVTTVLRTDRNLDLKIGPTELRNLMIRLDNTPGFDFHKDNFLKLLGNTDEPVPVEKIMKVIRNLKDDNVPEAENVFTINERTLAQ